MDLLQGIVLGIVQGLTEFLPISSTAHVRIIPAFLGWEDPGAAYTAVAQTGTLVAMLLYFRQDIRRMSGALVKSLLHHRPFETADSRLAWWILFGTIPIGVFGLLLKDVIETDFRSLYVISGSLIILALLLFAAEKTGRRGRDVCSLKLFDTQMIGLAQALALVPGASRSGTTIMAGLFLNLDREAAARFSFLLGIPAITLSGLYELYQLRDVLLSDFGVSLLSAVVCSGVVGYLTIGFLLRFLRNHSTYVFVFYRITLGLLILFLLSNDILKP